MSAWGNLKPVCSNQQAKSARDFLNPVVTTENIPPFTIPSLAIQEGHRIFHGKKSAAWRSHQWHSQDEGQWSQKSRRSISDPVCTHGKRSFSYSLDDLPDPVTRAAMSLPHLPKVTTPYGFVMLGESAHIAKTESVFFEMGRSMSKDALMDTFSNFQDACFTRVTGNCDNFMTIDQKTEIRRNNTQSSCNDLMEKYFKTQSRPLVSRRSSMSATQVSINQEKDIFLEKEWSLPNMCQRSNSLSKILIKKESRKLFQTILEKHFPNLKKSKFKSPDKLRMDDLSLLDT